LSLRRLTIEQQQRINHFLTFHVDVMAVPERFLQLLIPASTSCIYIINTSKHQRYLDQKIAMKFLKPHPKNNDKIKTIFTFNALPSTLLF